MLCPLLLANISQFYAFFYYYIDEKHKKRHIITTHTIILKQLNILHFNVWYSLTSVTLQNAMRGIAKCNVLYMNYYITILEYMVLNNSTV